MAQMKNMQKGKKTTKNITQIVFLQNRSKNESGNAWILCHNFWVQYSSGMQQGGGQGGQLPPPDFGRSVNPIATRGGWLCPPQYYLPSRIFDPCCIPVWEMDSEEIWVSWHELIFHFSWFAGQGIGSRVSMSDTVPHHSSLRRKISHWRIADPYFCPGEYDI